MRWIPWLLSSLSMLIACGPAPSPNPTELILGQTTLLVGVNFRINEQNQATVPAPGSQREDVKVSVDGGPSVVTGANGIAVLAEVEPGLRTLSFSNSSGTLEVTVVEGELRELAVAVEGSRAELMSDVRYPFAGREVVEVNPGMTSAQLGSELNTSNRIVLVEPGTYSGSGIGVAASNTTLFGAGVTGGEVILDANVYWTGAGNRIRGVRIIGSLTMLGPSNALSFSSVAAGTDNDGSDTVLVGNRLCGSNEITGSNLTVLENDGLAPLLPLSSEC